MVGRQGDPPPLRSMDRAVLIYHVRTGCSSVLHLNKTSASLDGFLVVHLILLLGVLDIVIALSTKRLIFLAGVHLPFHSS